MGTNAIPLLVCVIAIMLIVIVTIGIFYSYIKNKTLNELRGDVYQLFLKAEHAYRASSSGKQKMKYVISKARLLLPPWLQAMISETMLEKVVETWFREVKDLLDDGKVNGSQKEQGPGDNVPLSSTDSIDANTHK